MRRTTDAVIPKKYLVFRLDRSVLKSSLAQLKDAAASDGKILRDVPLADGTIRQFRMEETKTLSDELAKQFPDWKNFAGLRR